MAKERKDRENLQAVELFPAYLHREEPDEDGTASINGGSGSST